MIDVLGPVLGQLDQNVLKQQVLGLVPGDVQRILAGLGIRDEHVFPIPAVLEAQPTLVGYYRLLTGVGQKSFYRSGTGLAPFRKMENEGILEAATIPRLPEFCAALSDVIAELLRQMAPPLSARDVHELQLLTLGSTFYGSANTAIGAAAMTGVMDAIAEALAPYVTNRSPKTIAVTTPQGRFFTITRANDPDVRIEEATTEPHAKLLAIEVKGGSDAANVYNRGGEAEKSHKVAKRKGYPECWTVIRLTGIDVNKLQDGATSTDAWFDTAQVIDQRGHDWDAFRKEIDRIVGV